MANVTFQANQQFGELQNFVILEAQAELLAEQLALLIPNDPNPIAAKSLLVNNEEDEAVSAEITFEAFSTELAEFMAVDLATQEFADSLIPFFATDAFADAIPAKSGVEAIVAEAQADAATQTGLYVEADVQSIADLANALKAKVNEILAAMKVVA